MTIYASKTPRDLNRDPKCRNCGCTAHPPGDGINGGCRAQWVEPDGWTMTCGCREGQASAVPHVQHNEPNPILVAFRQDVADVFVAEQFNVAAIARSWIDGDALELFADMYPNEVLDHARRVLERLASLAG